MLAHHWRSALELARRRRPKTAPSWQTARASRSARPATAPSPSTRLRPPSDTTKKRSSCGPTTIPSDPTFSFGAPGRFTSRETSAVRRHSRELATRFSRPATSRRLRRAEAFLANGAWYEGRRDEADATDLGGACARRGTCRIGGESACPLLLGSPSDARGTERARRSRPPKEALAHRGDAFAGRAAGARSDHDRLVQEPSGAGSQVTPRSRTALALARDANSPMAGNILNNLAVLVVWEGDFRRADDLYQEAQAIAERFGDRDTLRFTRANGIHTWWVLGKWDDAAEAADRVHRGVRVVAPLRGRDRPQSTGRPFGLRGAMPPGALDDWESVARAGARDQRSAEAPPLARRPGGEPRAARTEDEARELADEALELAREHVDLACDPEPARHRRRGSSGSGTSCSRSCSSHPKGHGRTSRSRGQRAISSVSPTPSPASER